MAIETTPAEVHETVNEMLAYAQYILSLECLARVRVSMPCEPGPNEAIADRISEAFWKRPEPNALIGFVRQHKADISTPEAFVSWLRDPERGKTIVEEWCSANLTSALEVAAEARRVETR